MRSSASQGPFLKSSPDRSSRLFAECSHGFRYDHTYYEQTAVTQQDWVCDKHLYVTNTFVFNRLGEVLGTFIVGQMGDL